MPEDLAGNPAGPDSGCAESACERCPSAAERPLGEACR